MLAAGCAGRGSRSIPQPLTLSCLQFQRHLFVHISQQCPSPGAPPLESVDVRQIYDKFPEKKGGLRELYDRGPPHAFFLVKFWADLNWGPSAEEAGSSGGAGGFYGVSSQYESRELMTLTCSSKVCSFGKQVVEKVEVRPRGRGYCMHQEEAVTSTRVCVRQGHPSLSGTRNIVYMH